MLRRRRGLQKGRCCCFLRCNLLAVLVTASSFLLAFVQICWQSPSQPVMQGTTTNGTHLLPFKTGAFLAGAPVQPVILKYGKVDFFPWMLTPAALRCFREGLWGTAVLKLWS